LYAYQKSDGPGCKISITLLVSSALCISAVLAISLVACSQVPMLLEIIF